MSKGNMLFSQARGKVGDLVFSRLDGEQIVRSRNRHPKNPKTNAQLFQRAIMATVVRAYAAGKAIFDHSFQGKSVGAQNQRAFISLNAKRLRSLLSADLAAGAKGAGCAARVVAPGVTYPVAGKYQVSEGTLIQDLFLANGKLIGTEDVANETIGAYLQRKGIVADDIFTIVAFMEGNPNISDNVMFQLAGNNTVYGKQTNGFFGYMRLRVKASALESVVKLSDNPMLSDIFEVDKAEGLSIDISELEVFESIISSDTFPAGTYLLTSGVIRSRENEDLRSTTYLEWPESQCSAYGLTSDLLLAAWKQGSSALGESELILEGGFDGANVIGDGDSIEVETAAGAKVTLIGVRPGEEVGDTGKRYAKLIANDGNEYYLFGNSTHTLYYGSVLCYNGISGELNTWTTAPTGIDNLKINFNIDDDGTAVNADLAAWLISKGMSANAIAYQ